MNEDNTLALLIILLFGLLASTWFFSEVVNPFRQRSTLKEYEDSRVNCNAIVMNQKITLQLVNLIPSRKSHLIEYKYMAPGESVWRKKSVKQGDYLPCASLEPFPQQFSVLVLPGYPGSGYPTRWVQDRSFYFVPWTLGPFVSLAFTAGLAYPLALFFAGTINEMDPVFPTFYFILSLAMLLALGALPASWCFSNCWRWKTLEEGIPLHRDGFFDEQEMV